MAKARDVGVGVAAAPPPHAAITRPLARPITTYLTAGRPRERRFVTSTLLYYAGGDAVSPRFGTGCDPYQMMARGPGGYLDLDQTLVRRGDDGFHLRVHLPLPVHPPTLPPASLRA